MFDCRTDVGVQMSSKVRTRFPGWYGSWTSSRNRLLHIDFELLKMRLDRPRANHGIHVTSEHGFQAKQPVC